MNADAIRHALRQKFPAQEYALFFEVRSATGFSGRLRSADALAMSLWPSRGLELHGFEIKVSRGDWLRELKEPQKAEEIARFCHRWWLVVGDPKIVKEDELPATWGLLVPKAERLVVSKQAPLAAPEPLTPAMLASILRCAQANVEGAVNYRVEREVVARLDHERKALKEHTQKAEARAQSRYDALQKVLTDFERESGLHVNEYSGPRMANAVRLLQNGGAERLRAEALRAIQEIKSATLEAERELQGEKP